MQQKNERSMPKSIQNRIEYVTEELLIKEMTDTERKCLEIYKELIESLKSLHILYIL